MQIKIDFRGADGKRGWLDVVAEEFTIPGVTGHQFAVHKCPQHRGDFVATHIGTGFAMAREKTPEQAIEKARARWLECSPESLALKMIRAKNLTGLQGERVVAAA